jgi:hypothetical protein
MSRTMIGTEPVRYAPAKDPDTPPRLKPVRKQRKTKAQEGGTNA